MKAKIIGYGISGKAAESYLEAKGIETIVVADAKEKVSGDYDFCVVSPGVPQDDLKDEIVPIVPEVELPFFCEKKLKITVKRGENKTGELVLDRKNTCSEIIIIV